MEHAGVLGRPITHSLSPVLHRAAYAALGLERTFEALECGVDELTDVLAERAGWSGFACTMPLKHAALDIAAEVASLALAAGCANTLLPHPDGGWIAENTDVPGIVAALAEHDVRPRSVTILGAGATAQSAVAALLALGVGECTVLARDTTRAARVLETGQRLGVEVMVGSLEAAQTLGADLVISTLPAGAAERFAANRWTPRQAVLDVAYDPWPSALAASASAAGARVVSGALMLLHQATVQVTLLTGLPAPVHEMRAALRAAAPSAGL